MIKVIDINEIAISVKFPFGNQDAKCYIGYKNNKEIRPSCIFFIEMSIYKGCSDKTKGMFFMIKDETIFDKYMTIWEKFSNIIKTISSELIYNKKYLKAEKRFKTKESFWGFGSSSWNMIFFQAFLFPIFFFFFSIGIHSSKVEQQLQGTELQEKEVQKD